MMQEFLSDLEDGFDLRKFCDYADDLTSCPCFTITRKDFRASGQCWRSSYYYTDGHSCEHTGCCVHVWGDPDSANKIKELLDKIDWYGEWDLVIEAPKLEANF